MARKKNVSQVQSLMSVETPVEDTVTSSPATPTTPPVTPVTDTDRPWVIGACIGALIVVVLLLTIF